MNVFNRRKDNISDDDSDYEIRQRSFRERDRDRETSKSSSRLNDIRNPPSSSSHRDDRYESNNNRYGSYRNNGSVLGNKYNDNDKYERNSNSKFSSSNSKFNSDSDDDNINNRYGASSRRTVRHSSDSDDSDKNDRFTKSKSTGSYSARPTSSFSRTGKDSFGDIDSYESANQKLKQMIQYDKKLCEELDDLYEMKLAKEKKIDQLKDEIHRDTIKEENIRKKLNELRMNRKMLQARLDDYK